MTYGILQTIRAAYGDIRTINYTLSSPTINLSLISPTPAIDVDVVNAETDVVLTTIPCTIVTDTSGIVSFSLEDATVTRGMYKLLFRIYDTTGTLMHTIPADAEQGLWVY